VRGNEAGAVTHRCGTALRFINANDRFENQNAQLSLE